MNTARYFRPSLLAFVLCLNSLAPSVARADDERAYEDSQENIEYRRELRKKSDAMLWIEEKLQAEIAAASCGTSAALVAISGVASLIPFISAIPGMVGADLHENAAGVIGVGSVAGVLGGGVIDLIAMTLDYLPDGKISDEDKDEYRSAWRSREIYRRRFDFARTELESVGNISNKLLNENSACTRALVKINDVYEEFGRRELPPSVRNDRETARESQEPSDDGRLIHRQETSGSYRAE